MVVVVVVLLLLVVVVVVGGGGGLSFKRYDRVPGPDRGLSRWWWWCD